VYERCEYGYEARTDKDRRGSILWPVSVYYPTAGGERNHGEMFSQEIL
jgi:hypothetical protein